MKYLLNDEANFAEVKTAILYATTEEVLVSSPPQVAKLSPGDDMWVLSNRPFSVKLLHFVSADAPDEWPTAEYEARGCQLGALRHVRCHPVQVGPVKPHFMGVQGLWWSTMRAIRSGVTAAPGDFKALIVSALPHLKSY